jgi:tripartite ATP-independent transporter DctP family solute receptor
MRLRRSTLSCAVIALLFLSACSSRDDETENTSGAAAEAQPVTLRIGHTAPPGNDQFEATETLARLAAEKTGGKLKIETFPNSQLGGEEDLLEEIQAGSLEMAFLSSFLTSTVAPTLGVFDLPYLMNDYEAVEAAVTGRAAEITNEDLLSNGLRGLGYMYIGFRSTLCKDTVIEPPDYFDGLKIRVPGSPISLDTFENFGSSPEPIPYDEAFTALQTGVVDCFESPPQVILNSKFYEAAKDFTLTKHSTGGLVILVNEEKFQGLPEEYQTALTEAAEEATRIGREATPQTEDEALKALEAEGVRISELTDVQPLIEQSQPVYEKFSEDVGNPELLEAVRGE